MNLAIVGAHNNPTNAGLSNGSAYIFEYDNNLNEFVYLETLEQDSQSTNPSSLGSNSGNDRFGISVDIFDDGNIKYAAVVNSANKEAIIYENTGNGWIAVFNTGNIGNSMTWPNIVINSEYMALSQNTNVNGSNINQQNNVLIYKKTNGAWNLHQTINAEASSSNSYFSNDIALSSENKLAIGAYNHNDFGAVFIYEINLLNGEFELEETLIDQLSGSSSFGYAVDIDQNNLLIGNSGDEIVYKYYKDQTWQLEDIITVADVLSNGVTDIYGLGQSLALRNDIFFVNTMRDFLSLHRYSFINLSNDGEPIPEFKDYVLFSVILISGFAIFRRLPSIKYKKLKSGN